MKTFILTVGLVLVAAALALFCSRWSPLLEAGRLTDPIWVGTYHSGGGSSNHRLSIDGAGQFTDLQTGCAQYDEVRGIVDDTGGRLRLSPRRWGSGRLEETNRLPLVYLMIRWGPRRYLVPPEQILDFCAAVRSGGEPRDRDWGFYLLMEGDERIDPDPAEPQLPHGYEKYVRMKELDVGIKAVSASSAPAGEFAVTLDAGSFEGVLPRMRFNKPPPLDGSELVISETSPHESKGLVKFWRTSSGRPTSPMIGDRFQAPSPSASHPALRRVYPLAGKVTMDGRPPEGDGELVIMLYDPKEFHRLSERHLVFCRPNGEFSFSTSRADDGAEVGTYVVLLARLKHVKKPRLDVLLGPDLLGNRYNDPDKNVERGGFVIEHKKPGRADYVFDLKTHGVEPVKQPGPRALTGSRLAGGQ